MKPMHTFMFLFVIFIILAIIITIVPGGIFVSNIYKIKLPYLSDFIDTSTTRTDSAITEIFDMSHQVQKEITPDTSIAKTKGLIVKKDSDKNDTLKLRISMFNLQKAKIQPIEYPKGKEDLLSSFFNLLATGAADTSLIRILHYGDSQIERDRVTGYIRNLFQSKFGGSGPGMLPAFEPYGELNSVFHKASPNWIRFTTFGKVDPSIGHKRYGPMAAVSRMIKMPGQKDSFYNAFISIKKNPHAYQTLQHFNQCQVLIGNCPDTIIVQLIADGLLLQTEKINCPFLKKLKFTFPDFTNEIELKFQSLSSAEVYGLLLDNKTGIAVDNIAMRGSSGLEFTHIDTEHLKASLIELNPKLLILEFGGNIAPTKAKNYTFYGNHFFKELSFLKSLIPNVPIVVIGIADMSIKEGDNYVSFPNLINIRDEMKKATFAAGCAYWDLLTAMGGLNSMPQWVKAKPSLAGQDYVHFTDIGARVMGKMFCASLNKEYEEYIKHLK